MFLLLLALLSAGITVAIVVPIRRRRRAAPQLVVIDPRLVAARADLLTRCRAALANSPTDQTWLQSRSHTDQVRYALRGADAELTTTYQEALTFAATETDYRQTLLLTQAAQAKWTDATDSGAIMTACEQLLSAASRCQPANRGRLWRALKLRPSAIRAALAEAIKQRYEQLWDQAQTSEQALRRLNELIDSMRAPAYSGGAGSERWNLLVEAAVALAHPGGWNLTAALVTTTPTRKDFIGLSSCPNAGTLAAKVGRILDETAKHNAAGTLPDRAVLEPLMVRAAIALAHCLGDHAGVTAADFIGHQLYADLVQLVPRLRRQLQHPALPTVLLAPGITNQVLAP